MKDRVIKFKSMLIALKEVRPFIRDGHSIETGRPLARFGGLRPREIIANWLICAVLNANHGKEKFSFTSDPTGADGIILDVETGANWKTEHILVSNADSGRHESIESRVRAAITKKQQKGGEAYAKGKTLVIFINQEGSEPYFPSRIAKALPTNDFDRIWLVGLQFGTHDIYEYGVTLLHPETGESDIWKIRIRKFKEWKVSIIQMSRKLFAELKGHDLKSNGE